MNESKIAPMTISWQKIALITLTLGVVIGGWKYYPIWRAQVEASSPTTHGSVKSGAERSAMAGYQGKMCWEKDPETEGLNPGLRGYCFPVTHLVEVGGIISTIETLKGYENKTPGVVFVGNGTMSKGVWFTDQTRTERGGDWGLVKISDTLYAGHSTNMDGEQFAMSLQK